MELQALLYIKTDSPLNSLINFFRFTLATPAVAIWENRVYRLRCREERRERLIIYIENLGYILGYAGATLCYHRIRNTNRPLVRETPVQQVIVRDRLHPRPPRTDFWKPHSGLLGVPNAALNSTPLYRPTSKTYGLCFL